MKRAVVIVAAVLLALPAAAQDVMTGLHACRAQQDEKTRLACFDALVDSADQRREKTPAAAPVASAPADFGGENLQPAEASRPDEFMTAAVAKVAFNAINHFTVTLDNGQVWRQLDADTAVARFRDHATVKISKGFLDAYSLSIEGSWGSFKVKRIK